jgi:hypothetical protein
MKILYTIIFTIIRIALLGQTYQVAQDSLIRKHHVKQISLIAAKDTVDGKPGVIYQYDTLGNLVFHKTIRNHPGEENEPNDDHWQMSSVVRYFYDNKLLKKSVNDQNDYKDHFTDTTTFKYDHLDRMLNKTTNFYLRDKYALNGYAHRMTIEVQYSYINDTTMIVKEEIANDPRVLYDTLIYSHDKLLVCEVRHYPKGRFTYVYNDRKQLVSRTFTPLDVAATIDRNTFFYKEGYLNREEILSFTKDKSYTNLRSIDYKYIFNKKGLVEFYKVGQITSVVYKYEYY